MRFSFRIFWFCLLAVLALGLMAASRGAPAQQPAHPAASAATGQAAQSATPPPQSEADEMNGFLKSATVRSIAQWLHLSLTATEFIFLGINFAVIFLAIAIPLGRSLPKILRKRSESLRQGIESARQLTQDAQARLAAVEAQMAHLGDEIAKFRAEIEEDLKGDEARIKSAIGEESARIVAAAEQEIGLAAVQARRGLRKFAAGLAVDHAARQLVLTPETDRALISELIAEFAGGATHNHAAQGHAAGPAATHGGQN